MIQFDPAGFTTIVFEALLTGIISALVIYATFRIGQRQADENRREQRKLILVEAEIDDLHERLRRIRDQLDWEKEELEKRRYALQGNVSTLEWINDPLREEEIEEDELNKYRDGVVARNEELTASIAGQSAKVEYLESEEKELSEKMENLITQERETKEKKTLWERIRDR